MKEMLPPYTRPSITLLVALLLAAAAPALATAPEPTPRGAEALGAEAAGDAAAGDAVAEAEARAEAEAETRRLTRAYTSFIEARRLAAGGETSAARARLERVLELDPGAPTVHASLARLCLRDGDLACAQREAALAIELDDETLDAHKVLAEIALGRYHRSREARFYERALGHLEAASKADPLDPAIWVAWIRVLGGEGRIDEAESIARRAADVGGLDASIPFMALARMLLARGQEERAIEVLESAEVPGLAAIPLLETLVELKGGRGDLEGQAKALSDLLRLEPGDAGVARRLGAVLLELGDPFGAIGPLESALALGEDDPLVKRDLARALVQLGRGEDALPLLEALPMAYRTAPSLHLWARAAEQADQPGLAATRLEQLLELLDAGERRTLELPVRFRAASSWLEAGEPERALALLEGQGSPDVSVLRLRLEALDALERGEEADALLAARREEEPRDRALFALFVERRAERRGDEAAFEAALSGSAGFAEREAALATVARWLAEWERASLGARLVDALELSPRPDPARLRDRAVVLYAAGRLGEAEAAYRRLLEIEPGNHGALNDLGYLLASEGRELPEAISMLKRALAAAPDEPAYLDSLGLALLRAGRPEEALPLLREAARKAGEREQAEIREHLGDVYFALGDLDRARAEWRAALLLGSERREALLAKLADEHLDPAGAASNRREAEDAP